MSLIVWDQEKLGLGIERIDQQHQRWIEIINQLHEILMGSEADVSHEETLAAMLDYCEHHFADEEALMREVDYPGYKDHKKAHDEFKYRLKEMERDLRSGDIVLRSQILGLMKNWLQGHIGDVDRKLGDYIAQREGS